MSSKKTVGRGRRMVVGVVLAATALTGFSAGMSATSSAGQSSALAAVSTAKVSTGVSSALQGAANPGAQQAPAMTPLLQPQVGDKNWRIAAAKAVWNFVKNSATTVFNAMKSAIRAGYSSFKRWYDDLQWMIKRSIDFIWTGGLYELYQYLRDLLLSGF